MHVAGSVGVEGMGALELHGSLALPPYGPDELSAGTVDVHVIALADPVVAGPVPDDVSPLTPCQETRSGDGSDPELMFEFEAVVANGGGVEDAAFGEGAGRGVFRGAGGEKCEGHGAEAGDQGRGRVGWRGSATLAKRNGEASWNRRDHGVSSLERRAGCRGFGPEAARLASATNPASPIPLRAGRLRGFGPWGNPRVPVSASAEGGSPRPARTAGRPPAPR